MQIDFHHAATYVCCRLAGMARSDAAVVAHASQYVDDATNDGPLQFRSGERYVRVTSAHRTLDLINNQNVADNRLVWVPFHFLPGNDPSSSSLGGSSEFIRRMICRPGSDLARAMVLDAVEKKELRFGLHRFGIALHTFIDTWAHQGFVGMVDDINRVDSIDVFPDPAYSGAAVFSELRSGAMKAKAFVANHLPVGHAGVLTLPDLPFLVWRYTRANGEVIERNNPSDFERAAMGMFNMARRFVQGDTALPDAAMDAGDRAVVAWLIRSTLAIDGADRHAQWIEAIRTGRFSFGPESLAYVESGPGSWKMEALGSDPDVEDGRERFDFTADFLDSNWKRFHDAVQYQRLFVLHELLPRFGIVAS